MENVRIAVLDIGNHAVAFMDNRVPKALHFYNDEQLKAFANLLGKYEKEKKD